MNITIPDWKNSTKGLKISLNQLEWLKDDLNLMEWHKGHLNHMKWLKGDFSLKEWPNLVLLIFTLVFTTIFVYYSLAFLCLFYSTEILRDGVTRIILEGASPVCLRSFGGNYFLSRKEGIWCKAKTFILRVFITPLPLLYSASTVFADFENAAFAKLLLDKKVLIVSASCYCIQAFCSSFSKRSLKVKRYLLRKFLKPAILSCHD